MIHGIRAKSFCIEKGLLARMGELLFGASDHRLVRPMAVIAVGTTLYVADPGAQGVHRFDPANARYDLLRGPDDAPLLSPVALASGAAGEVYVSDSALARIFVIRPGAKYAAPLVLERALAQPTGIAYDPALRRLHVVETASHRVQVFDASGRSVSAYGQRGAGPGEFNYPTLIWRAADGRLYVTDSLNFRIQVFDAQGRFVAKFGRAGDGAGDLARHKGVALDRHGHVYVMDALLQAMQIFDDRGRLLLSLGGLGEGRGEFWLPAGISVTEDDRIYVADSHNGRVQVFRYIGGGT